MYTRNTHKNCSQYTAGAAAVLHLLRYIHIWCTSSNNQLLFTLSIKFVNNLQCLLRWLWSPYVIGQTIIFSCCGFFFFFPRLISAAADWMSAILPHMVWPYCEFKMQVWNLLHAARWKHRTQKSRQKSPSGHHRTTLLGYIFATKARIDNRKKTC